MTAESTFARHRPDLAGRRVLVLGLGRSGLAAARLLSARGAVPILADRRPAEQLGAALELAAGLGARLHVGGHPPALLAGIDLIVVSPGVPVGIELLRTARERGIEIWSEVELASRYCEGRIVGVTGSNGKSTVTSLVGAILRRDGIAGGTGGNLATPFCDLLESDAADAVHAVELSSFQLETVSTLQADVALLLNLSPDHLDRHGSFEAYARAKARLFELQGPAAWAVLCDDDEPAARVRPYLRGRLAVFSLSHDVPLGGMLDGEDLVLQTPAGEDRLCRVGELSLRGRHNVANSLAAALACRLLACSPEAIRDVLTTFRALPHRLQHVGTVRGVEFYNDSKATNPASTMRALESFAPGTVWLILGGRDKGADWSELAEAAAGRVKRLLLVGEAAAGLRDRLAEIPATACGTVAAAVEQGFRHAVAGDVVLLSPGCASFDQYENFEARGDDFRREVERLAHARREGDDDA